MDPKPPNFPSERQETDQSLRDEREKTDTEMSKRHLAIDETSDAVVRRARGRADEVLDEARGKADATLVRERASNGQHRAVHRERVQQDAALDQERLAADDKLKDERLERIRALTSLLQMEREETDERLLIERAHGDAALAARDDFLGMVSHDLRTLLGGIALSATQITRESGEEAGERNIRAAEKIKRFTWRINRLVGDLVDVASVEAGRFTVEPEEQDVVPLMNEALETFRSTASAKNIALRAAPVDGALLAAFDHDRIFQVFANVLSNAIKFTSAGGEILVKAESSGNEVRFSVKDTGAGIARDQLESIFERFWQGTKGDSRGLGLGLFIAKCIMEAHGGRIWAESQIGRGTTIFFTLPPGGRHLGPAV